MTNWGYVGYLGYLEYSGHKTTGTGIAVGRRRRRRRKETKIKERSQPKPRCTREQEANWPNAKCPKCTMQDAGYGIQDTGYRIPQAVEQLWM